MSVSDLKSSRLSGASLLALVGIASSIVGILTLELPSELLRQTSFSPTSLKVLSIVQSSVFIIAAVAAGYFSTHPTGLTSIFVDRHPRLNLFALLFIPLGALTGLGIWALDATITAHFPGLASFYLQNEMALDEMNTMVSPITRLAYVGIVEEILARYGVMSILALIFLKVFKNKALALSLAIVTSSLLFGLGHLHAIVAYIADPPTLFLMKTVVLNAVAAATFACAFTLHSLEAAMLAHIGFHLAVMLLN